MIGRRFARVAIIAVATSLVFACSTDPEPAAEPVTRVTMAAGALALDGKPWAPYGFNSYQLATDYDVNAGCGAEVTLDRYFATLPPHSTTRFNAFQTLATDKHTGKLDFGPIDAVFATAEKYDQLLIPVLAPQDGACDGEVFKERQWYVDGWRTTPDDGLSFRDWMRAAVERWRHSPALAAWELVGEPETSVCTDADCTWFHRDCPADAPQVLRAFFDTAGTELRHLDPSTLITAGLVGGGQCGSSGSDYAMIGESPWVDILQYHDYGADYAVLPGDQWNGLAHRLSQARALGKPLLVGEIGIRAGSCRSVTDRAALVQTKLDGQRLAGAAGALLWAFVPDPRPAMCTYDIGYDDPIWDILDRAPRG